MVSTIVERAEMIVFLRNILLLAMIVSTLASCSKNSNVSPVQTPGVEPVSIMPAQAVSVPTQTLGSKSPPFITEMTEPTMHLLPTLTMESIPSDALSAEVIINSNQSSVGVLFLDKDGLIVKQFANGYELSAVPKANYLYRVHAVNQGRGIQIDQIDLEGNVINDRLISLGENYNSLFYFNYSVSPDGKWLAYMHGDNDYDPRFSENIDFWLLRTDITEGKPLLITKNRRSTNKPVTWAATGNTFAYADKDESGIVQIFQMDADTQKKVQITHFNESLLGQWIYQAKFSPDGKKVAFITAKNNGISKLGVADVDKMDIVWMEIPSGFQPQKDPLWWGEDETQIMVLISGAYVNNVKDSHITWYEVETGKPVRFFPENEERFPYRIEHVFPLEDINNVGFWGYDADVGRSQYWLLETKNKDLKKLDLPDLGVSPYQIIQLQME